jgi:hypothetical protein
MGQNFQNKISGISNKDMQRLQKHQNACTALQLPRKKSAEL